MSQVRRLLKLVLAVLFAALLLGAVRPESATVRVYVPNQMSASISVLDGAGRLLETIDLQALGFSAHAMPHQVAARADGSAWYVTLAGDGFILKFDHENRLQTRTVVAEPGMVVLDARRDLLYVSRALASANPPRSLAVLRASDLVLLDEPDIFIARPHALAIDTVSGRAYAGSLATNEIAAVDFRTGSVRITDVGGPPQAFVGLAVSPDGSTLVATTQLTASLLAFETHANGALTPVASIAVEALPYDVAYSPDGASVWFPNQRAGAVTRVDTKTWTVGAVIRHAAFEEPHGVAVSADRRTVFVSSHGRAQDAQPAEQGRAEHGMDAPRANGTLAVIDAESGDVRSVTIVGPYAAALGLADSGGQRTTDPVHAQHVPAERQQKGALAIPSSMKTEHAAIHSALAAATREPGRVGAAARAVARVLDPHFVREEEIALPPLGLLEALARGEFTREMEAVLPLTDALKAELPRMLEEHRAIHSALVALRDAAHADQQLDIAELAEEIMLHASTEEQVTYPTAILVGDHVRLRLRGH